MPPNHLFLCHPLLLPTSILTASGSFHMSQFFTSGGQSIGDSASASVQFSSVQSISHIQIFETPGTAACQASLSITNSRSPPKPMFIESVMPSNYHILCRPLLLLPSIFPSIRVFSNESALRIRWPKYWSFSFNISPTHGHPGLISFRMDWLDLLAVQRTLRSLLQHHSSKASILLCSAFVTDQLSLPYMTTGKTIVLTRRTFPVEVRNRFKGLDLIDRVLGELWIEVRHTVQETGIKTIPPKKRSAKKQNGCLRRPYK